MTNSPKLPVVVAKSCLTSKFAESAKYIGEAFVLNPSGGGIAYFGATRVSPTELGALVTSKWAGQLDWMLSEKFFSGERIAGKVWGEAIKDYVKANDLTSYYEKEVKGYLDWWTVANIAAPLWIQR